MKKSLLLFLVVLFAGSAAAQSRIDMNWHRNDDIMSVRVDMDGEFTFTDDYRAVASMSRGSHMRIKSDKRGDRWELEVERDGGAIVYDYRKNGRRIAFEDAREEIGDAILWVIRESGLYAEERVAQILDRGGPNAVFAEIEAISSGGSSSRYIRHLVDQASLDTGDLKRVASMIEDEVYSSGDRSRTLIATADEFVGNPDAMTSWIRTAAGIPSSGDRSRTLIHALGEDLSDGSRGQVIAAAGSIPSSGDKSRVLLRALQSDLSSDALTEVLEVTLSIASSGDKGRVLIKAGEQFRNTTQVRSAYFAAAAAISSSGDRSRVLLSVLRNGDLDTASLIALLETASSISSSGDKARLLVAVAPHVDGEALEDAFLDATESISSSGDRGRVLSALMRNSQ